MDANTNTLVDIIEEQEKYAHNRVSTSKRAICVNFIQIDKDTLMITITFMLNHRMNAKTVQPDEFHAIFNVIDTQMAIVEQWYKDYCEDHDIVKNDWTEHGEYFAKCEDLGFDGKNGKYKSFRIYNIKCHKLFFVPVCCFWEIMRVVFAPNSIDLIKAQGITEVNFVMHPDNPEWDKKI